MHSITHTGVLGLPKIEMERKAQKKFQADFIKLMFQHKGGSTEESKVLSTGWGQSGLHERAGFLKVAVFILTGYLPGNHVRACAFGQDGELFAHCIHPRKVI